jgi:hypothetical protein
MKRIYLYGMVMALAMVLCLGGIAQAQNLVVNNGFDAIPTTTPNGLTYNITNRHVNAYPDGFPNLGWKVEWVNSNDVRPEGLTPKLEIQSNGVAVSGTFADYGSNWVELDSDWTGPFSSSSAPNPPYRNGVLNNTDPNTSNGEPASVRISQELNTTLPGPYKLEFAFAARPGTDEADNHLIAKWGGSVVFDQTKAPGSVFSWQKFTISDLTTYADKTTLSFEDAGTPDSYGTYLDTVVVTRIGEGCVYTQGYWKTHSKYGPASFDDTWDHLLVNDDENYKEFFGTGKTWYEVINTPPKKGNAYIILAHQYIAAWLNLAKGAAAPDGFETYMQDAATLLGDNSDYFEAPGPPKADRQQYLDLASILQQYNEGTLEGGPGPCCD